MIMCPRCGAVLEMRENRRSDIIKTLNSREVRCPRCFNGRWASIYRNHTITDRELADAFVVMPPLSDAPPRRPEGPAGGSFSNSDANFK